MSDLAFLSSDEEESIGNDNSVLSNISDKKTSLKKDRHNSNKDDDEHSSDEEFGNDFEFGGMLGEDGDSQQLSYLLSNAGNNSWSYKSALKILEQNDNNGFKLERTNVASIIAAARQNLKREEENAQKEEKDDEEDSEGDETNGGSDTGSSDTDEKGSDDDTDDDDSDSSGDESSDDEVDDVEKVKDMDQDIVRERQGKRKKLKASMKENTDESDEEDGDDNEEESDTESSDEEERRIEREKAAKYFDNTADNSSDQNIEVFAQLNLSRPLLRGVASIGFVSPTPIQARVIPIALSGRDVCASAQTGSGKTAAFLLPIMERILQRGGGKVQYQSKMKSKKNAITATRGLVLTPTRELAAQCLGMMNAIAKFTDLRASLIVGGSRNISAQAAELRTRPDIIVATPGRLIDHLTNSSGVDLDDLEFLILDEADRLLDLGFQDEIHEVVKACPAERQTLLFSATMGTKVDDLIKLSLKRPVRIRVTGKSSQEAGVDATGADVEVANRLEQEFVRVRASNEGVNREAMLLALLTRTYTSRVIVFFDTKADAHRLMIVCGLCGIKCAELHGNLTQVQRLEALENFREGSVDVLLATDLAARGLDISSVQAVINFEMPGQVDTYVHRIGRTARAGRAGKACTLIGEGRRQLMKAVMKDAEQKRQMEELKAKSSKGKAKVSSSTGTIRSRTIPTAVLKHFAAKILSLEPHIKEVHAAEAVARMDRIAEMEANKAQNMIKHGDEIKSRPQREWFASNKDKMSAKERYLMKQEEIKAKVGTGMHRMTRKKRRMREAKQEFDAMHEEAIEQFEETGERSKRVMTENAQKSSAKGYKKQLNDQQKERESRSLHDEDNERKQKRKQKEKIAKKRKGAFATDALGDSGLFEDEAIAHAAKPKKAKVAKSSFEFTEYDPNKPTRKHKAKSHHGFKSKSKFKRRK